VLRICQNFHLMAVIVKKLDNRMKNDRKNSHKDSRENIRDAGNGKTQVGLKV